MSRCVDDAVEHGLHHARFNEDDPAQALMRNMPNADMVNQRVIVHAEQTGSFRKADMLLDGYASLPSIIRTTRCRVAGY